MKNINLLLVVLLVLSVTNIYSQVSTQSEYKYDNLNRLIYSKTVASTSVTLVQYSYDILGNITNKRVSTVPIAWNFAETSNKSTITVEKTGANSFCNRAIKTGDVIGFFYLDNGKEKCAGYNVWIDGQDLTVTLWGDNTNTSEKDGYAANEKYLVKMWDAVLNKEFIAKGTLKSGNSYFTSGSSTVYSSIDVACSETHTIALAKGWNMISTYIVPKDDKIINIFEPIASNMVIVKNGAGLMYIPDKSLDLIKNWNVKHGYLLYMTTADELEITGMPLSKESLLSLSKGWNIMAYTRKTEQAITNALAAIVSDFLIVKNGAGLMYIPSQNINLIGDIKPGAGYLIYMKNSASLDYPGSNLKRTVEKINSLPSHLIAKSSPYNMNVIVESDLPNNWEIGAYNADGVLVGSGLVENGKAAVTIFADDENTVEIDGAVADEILTFKAYNPENDLYETFDFAEIKDIVTEKMLSAVNYSTNTVLTAKAVTEIQAGGDYFVNIYPNPTKNKIELQINFSELTPADVKVYDLQGNELISVFAGNLPQGETKLQINCELLPNGTYNVFIQMKDKSITKRFVVAR